MWWVLAVLACHRGIDWNDFECDVDPVEIPAELGIEDDSEEWRCGDEAPEKVKNYGDWGVRGAGLEACFAGEEGTISGPDVYVAPDGSDDAAGNSEDRPLATLAAALCRASAGQTIHLAPGTYSGPGAVVGALGERGGDEVVVRGEGEGPEDVVIDGGHWRAYGMAFTDSYNVRIENLTVQNWSGAGIYTLGGSGFTLRNLVVRNNGRCNEDLDAEGEGFGIDLVGTSDVLVEDCVIEDNGPLYDFAACGTVLGTGINTFQASGTIRGNEIRRTRGGAILVEDGGPFTVEDNRLESNFLLAVDNYWDAGIWIDGSHDVTVRNNTFRDNWGGAGVQVSDEEHSYPDDATGISIEGNTITGHVAGVVAWGYGECPPPDDAVEGWAELASTNDLSGNSFRGEDTPTMCDPDFVGGEEP